MVMNEVTNYSLETNELPEGNQNSKRSDDLDQTLLDQTIVGNISSTLGDTAIDLTSSK